MKKFEIGVPIHCWQIFTVEAETEQDAIELVAGGNIDSDYLDDIRTDDDTNNWTIDEVG